MAETVAPEITESSILARLLDLRSEQLTPAAAEFFLGIQFSEQDIARMNHLSDLAQEGALNTNQGAELDAYIRVGNLLALMQSRARRLVKAQAAS
jgi:hypothetical protein